MFARSPGQEITLPPGAYAFAESEAILTTLLGSCVAITFWHPRFRFGAMCHYLLPARPQGRQDQPVGCYADEALAAISNRFLNLGMDCGQLEVRMFGGGNMFPMLPPRTMALIGEQNIEAGRRLLGEHGFAICQEDLAGEGHRKISFELSSGRVTVQHGVMLGSDEGGGS